MRIGMALSGLRFAAKRNAPPEHGQGIRNPFELLFGGSQPTQRGCGRPLNPEFDDIRLGDGKPVTAVI